MPQIGDTQNQVEIRLRDALAGDPVYEQILGGTLDFPGASIAEIHTTLLKTVRALVETTTLLAAAIDAIKEQTASRR